MSLENLYEVSLDSACAMDTSMVQTYDDVIKFLLNLTYSHQTELRIQQIHYLFVALEHLNNVEKEIHISDENEDIIRLKRILDKIRSQKKLIQEFIRHLNSQD